MSTKNIVSQSSDSGLTRRQVLKALAILPFATLPNVWSDPEPSNKKFYLDKMQTVINTFEPGDMRAKGQAVIDRLWLEA